MQRAPQFADPLQELLLVLPLDAVDHRNGDREQILGQIGNKMKTDRSNDNLNDASSRDEPGTLERRLRTCRKGGRDQQRHRGLLPHPRHAGITRREHAVNQCGAARSKNEPVILVSGDRTRREQIIIRSRPAEFVN